MFLPDPGLDLSGFLHDAAALCALTIGVLLGASLAVELVKIGLRWAGGLLNRH